MNFRGIVGLVTFGVALAASAFEVTDVTARQRWPWNSLIDVGYEIAGAAAGDLFVVDVTATYDGGTKTIVGKTYKTDPVGAPGANGLVWDFGADAPGVKAEDLCVSVTVTPFTDKAKVYCVIDISGGKDATQYPVRYTREDPVHTPNDTNDVCKLTEIWLRRIHPAGREFYFGSYKKPADDNNSFYARMTKDYYIAVFETTQQQWFQLTGNWASEMTNEAWRATRPLDKYYPGLLFGSSGWKWPDTKTFPDSSVMGKLRARSGLSTINLPTESQWQFAASAGPTSGTIYRYRDPDGNTYALADIARYSENGGDIGGDYNAGPEKGSACVGSYKPNAFGLYDMIGNVGEDCIEPWVSLGNLKDYLVEQGVEFPVSDFNGLPQATAKELNGGNLRATFRTQGFRTGADYQTLWYRGAGYTGYSGDKHPCCRGFRFCITCE